MRAAAAVATADKHTPLQHNRLVLLKNEIDGPHKDKHNRTFQPEFALELRFAPATDDDVDRGVVKRALPGSRGHRRASSSLVARSNSAPRISEGKEARSPSALRTETSHTSDGE